MILSTYRDGHKVGGKMGVTVSEQSCRKLTTDPFPHTRCTLLIWSWLSASESQEIASCGSFKITLPGTFFRRTVLCQKCDADNDGLIPSWLMPLCSSAVPRVNGARLLGFYNHPESKWRMHYEPFSGWWSQSGPQSGPQSGHHDVQEKRGKLKLGYPDTASIIIRLLTSSTDSGCR